MWFFKVGLSGKDGTLNKTWPVKTLETLLKENNHMFVSKSFLTLLFVQLIHDTMGVLRGYKMTYTLQNAMHCTPKRQDSKCDTFLAG